MGILQNLVDNADEKLKTVPGSRGSRPQSRPGMTPDAILTNEKEVMRLSRYIKGSEKKKILNVHTGVKHGVNKIGTVGDSNKVLKDLLAGATKKAKKFAAKILVKAFLKDNLKEEIITKTGKKIVGKLVSKNIYLKEVKFIRGGKLIQYVQARSRTTGRVVKYSTALRLISRKG